MDARLKSINVRSYWGINNSTKSCNNLVSYRDNEVIYSVGSKLVILDYVELRSRIIPLHYFDIHTIHSFTMSPDLKYLAVSIKLASTLPGDRKLNMISIDMDSLQAIPKKPFLFEHVVEGAEGDNFYVSAMAYSYCSTTLAIGTSAPEVGLFLLDRFSGTVLHKLATNQIILQIHFNPHDKDRICSSGQFNHFQFWRVTTKMAHHIPVSNLLRGSNTYTCHAWVADNRIVAGTKSGHLLLVEGGSILTAKKVLAFGAPDRDTRADVGVVDLLIRNDIVICISSANVISMFELRRGPTPVGGMDVDYSFIKLARLRLPTADITGIRWIMASTTSNYEVVISTYNSLVAVDLKAGDYKMAAVETHAANSFQNGRGAGGGRNSVLRNSFSGTSGTDGSDWIDQKIDKVILTFHSANIHSLSMGTRNSAMVTASDDETIRIWDYSAPNKPCLLVDNFSDRKNVVPNSICVHPSGVLVAFGCEDDVREFYATDSKFEMVRRLPTKIPFTGPGDVPFVNTLPVSVVKYSHGGHLLAAVTGRMAQLFHMYTLEFNSQEPAGIPTRIMAITDHKALINDIVFSSDDSQLFTCSVDGSIYSWQTAVSDRTGEFIEKGVPCLKLAVSWSNPESHKYIVASFASDYYRVNTTSGRKQYMLSLTRDKDKDKKREKGGFMRSPSGRSDHVPMSRMPSEATANTAAGQSSEGDEEGQPRSGLKRYFLCVWKDVLSIFPEVINLECAATALTFGRLDGHWADRKDLLVIGLQDGRVLISMTPIPFRVVAASQSIPTGLSTRNITSRTSSAAVPDPDDVPFLNAGTSGHDVGGGAIGGISGAGTGATTPSALARENCILDMNAVAKLQLHAAEVAEVAVSASGFWIYSTGFDNTVFMLSSSMRAKEFIDVPEAAALENQLLVTEKSHFQYLKSRMDDVDSAIEETKRDCERNVHKITEQKNHLIAELEAAMKREVQKRDDIILRGREDQARQVKKLNEEIVNIQKRLSEDIVELEYAYEKKLSQEALYLEKMRQAFDEVVVHSRLDMADAQRQVAMYDAKLMEQKNAIMAEAEKQKALVLAYVDYVKQRYTEVVESLEEGQEEERMRLKGEVTGAKSAVDDMRKQTKEEIVLLNRHIHDLNKTIASTEDDGFKLKSDLEWANTRIHKLEIALGQATTEVKRYQESSEKWEFKVGEYQEQVRDLEKVRKSLTSQLHLLRQELGPKEEKLLESSERLHEVEREYEQALFAISEKELNLSRKGESLHLLQKQLGELRNTCLQKDATLRRVAKVFEEYKYTMQQNSMKKSLHLGVLSKKYAGTFGHDSSGGKLAEGSETMLNDTPSSVLAGGDEFGYGTGKHRHLPTEKVTITVRNESVESVLKRLGDILKPYQATTDSVETSAVDSEAEFEERQRQVQLLHNSIEGLRTNLEFTHLVSSAKIKNHITDNMHLLKEVNDLRHEVRAISLENQRLKASKRFVERMRSERQDTQHKLAAIAETEVRSSSPNPPNMAMDALNADIDNSVATGSAPSDIDNSKLRRLSSSQSTPALSRPSQNLLPRSRSPSGVGISRTASNNTRPSSDLLRLDDAALRSTMPELSREPAFGQSERQSVPSMTSFNDDIDTARDYRTAEEKIAELFNSNAQLIQNQKSASPSVHELLKSYQDSATSNSLDSPYKGPPMRTGSAKRRSAAASSSVISNAGKKKLPVGQKLMSLPDVVKPIKK